MTCGVYAGSFDPFTKGHYNVVLGALTAFDSLVIAIGTNSQKNSLFSLDQRKDIIGEYLDRVYESKMKGKSWSVEVFDGLLLSYCTELAKTRKEKVVIVRGLRAVNDLETELALADANRRVASHMGSNIPTVFIPAAAELAFISSSIVKELARFSGPGFGGGTDVLEDYVLPTVAKALRAKMH